MFKAIGNFFANTVWNGGIKPAATFVWHIIGGAVTGAVLPTLAQTAMAGHLTTAGAVSTVVSGVVGAIIGYAQHSNNQVVAANAGQITPDMQKQIDDKVSDAIESALFPKPVTPPACPACNQPLPAVKS